MLIPSLLTMLATQACPPCALSFTPTDTLGALSDPGSVGMLAEAHRTPSGFALVSSSSFGPMVMVYQNGAYARELSREGGGPGEFTRPPQFSLGANPSFVAFSPRDPLVHVFDSETLSFKDAFRVPGPPRSIVPDPTGEGWVVGGVSGETRRSVHLIGADGQVLNSFGSEDRDAIRFAPFVSTWGSYVLATTRFGEITLFDRDGQTLGTATLDTLDLAVHRDRQPVNGSYRGDLSGVVDILVQGDLLRVFIHHRIDDGGAPPPDFEIEDLVDTTVITLSLPGLEQLSVDRFDSLLRPLGGDWAFDLITTELGDRQVRLGRLSTR